MYQVPLPILIVLDYIWYKKGSHEPVYFSQTGTGSGKSYCSIKLCLRQHGIQPKIAEIFQVTERSIANFDKNPTKMM